ncbi:MAG: dual specificity protein kinase kns1 [Chrysothrix sp. TS-e1954]|nr:MAG: dual specificity protein kinase kns1 [Chrysothrix sp. TS-e1954]
MASARPTKKADWNDFYRNGIPKEVIVIDDSPEPLQDPSNPQARSYVGNMKGRTSQHVDKRRKTAATSTAYDPVTDRQRPKPVPNNDDSTSNETGSSGRTQSAMYSTAPTSLTSQGSGSRVARTNGARTGQKRKRDPRKTDSAESPECEVIAQNHNWSNYVPPPRPPVKAQDVYVAVIRDKASRSHHKIDDEDGHYVVHPDTELTERYTITRLLGQGTFGKVVEAYDRKKQTKCAVKIIRAVPKYRDASRIELRVLATLASNDKQNRNRCIHLRDCFDFRNHICIVTDLLGQSVFDFLKNNQFVPFPNTHIQSFARQLLTSVACKIASLSLKESLADWLVIVLHDLNLIHTDLKPENILLVNNNYQTFTYSRTIPSSSKATTRTSKYRRVLLDPNIRLIDFGSATFDDEYHSSVVSTRHYRAPEIILNLGWSFPCDIWSIGCILVEFFTGDALFQTHDNLEHLAMMESVCNAKIDPDIIRQVRVSNRGGKNSAASYFPPRAARLDYPTPDTPRQSKKYIRNMKKLDVSASESSYLESTLLTLNAFSKETIPPNTEFNRQFLELLRRIFVYDPKKRITAKEALAHPWFSETMQDDGTEALKIRLSKEANGSL